MTKRQISSKYGVKDLEVAGLKIWLASSTLYIFFIEGVEVDFNDSWCPGATISLYEPKGHGWDKRASLYTTIDCPKVLRWTPPARRCLRVGIEYLKDGHLRRERLAAKKEADEIASQAAYDECDQAHIVVTSTLSVGTSTVWFRVHQTRFYPFLMHVDFRLVVEFGNSEECTRFLQEDLRKLEHRFILDMGTGVAFIGDIMRALVPIRDDILTVEKNAAQRGIPLPQFVDDLPQPETQLIRHQGSNRGHHRPCYVTLHISTWAAGRILRVDWSEINNSPACPSRSDTFRSLNSLHLKFPSPASQDRNPNSSSQSHQDDLTISISAREISFLDGTNSVSAGNSFSINSVHRTVTINYINAMGDAFLAPISGGTNGGRNNVNNSFSMRTDEGAGMLGDLRSINDLANGSLANSPLTTGSTDLRSDQSMIGTKPARKTISTYARRFATAIRFRPPRTT